MSVDVSGETESVACSGRSLRIVRHCLPRRRWRLPAIDNAVGDDPRPQPTRPKGKGVRQAAPIRSAVTSSTGFA